MTTPCSHQLKKHKSIWFAYSFIFSAILLLLSMGWKRLLIASDPILWTIIVVVLVPLAGLWWYWTIVLIAFFLDRRDAEVAILKDIITEVHMVREEVEELKKNNPN